MCMQLLTLQQAVLADCINVNSLLRDIIFVKKFAKKVHLVVLASINITVGSKLR